jgi:hypothetical protein
MIEPVADSGEPEPLFYFARNWKFLEYLSLFLRSLVHGDK